MLPLIFILTVIVFLFVYLKPPSPKEIQVSPRVNIEESNEIVRNIEKTDLTKKVLDTLKVNGYNVDQGVAFAIYSRNDQIISLRIKDIDVKDVKEKNKIEKIINKVAQENNFNNFTLELVPPNIYKNNKRG